MSYHDILASVAIRANALVGSLAPALETAFTTRPLTTAQFQSTVFPMSACKQALLNTEEKLAHAIANTSGHPWRADLADSTPALIHGAPILSLTVKNLHFIGEFGSVRDATDLNVCTVKPLPIIRRRVRNANNFYRTPVYYYNIDGGMRIFHTRTSVVIDVCSYSRAAQITLISNDGAVLLSDVLEEAYICGTVSLLVRDDEFSGQAAVYRNYFNDTLAMIHGGFTAVPAKVAA